VLSPVFSEIRESPPSETKQKHFYAEAHLDHTPIFYAEAHLEPQRGARMNTLSQIKATQGVKNAGGWASVYVAI